MPDLAKIAEDLSALTVVDAAALVKMLEEKWGVKAASGGGGGGGGAAVVAPPPEVVKKTEFTIVLTNAGAEKIKVIKEIRAITGLGLKEAKDLVDGAPKNVKEDVPEEEAKKIKEILEKVGAQVELK